MVLSLLVIQVLGRFWHMEETLTYTFNLLAGGAVAMMVVVKVCRPMNWLRRALSISIIVIFCAGILVAPGFLGIYSIFRWEMALMVPLLCMVVVFFKMFTDFAEGCFWARRWIKRKMKRKVL